MKLAIFSPTSLSTSLGASKHRVEQCNAMKELGWSTKIFSPEDLGLDKNYMYCGKAKQEYRVVLRSYLLKNANQYDFVLYECDALPYLRSLFSNEVILIASPSLLFYHFNEVFFPLSLKSRLKGILDSFNYKQHVKESTIAEFSLQQADVIQVQCNSDKKKLIQKGFQAKNIITVPCGLTLDKMNQLSQNYTTHHGKSKKVVFIGTFDFRKGALDIPKIVMNINNQIPDCTFLFLGTKGMLQDEKQVKEQFVSKLHGCITVIPIFNPDDLPSLLSECMVGMFPSYIESFGIGVLEMMAAGIPVVCYKSPGPQDFVPNNLLIKPGDIDSFSNKLIQLIKDENMRQYYSNRAIMISKEFCWSDIAYNISSLYKSRIKVIEKSK